MASLLGESVSVMPNYSPDSVHFSSWRDRSWIIKLPFAAFQSQIALPNPPKTNMLVAIAADVENPQVLIAGVLPGTEVVLLNDSEDGIAQISRILAATPAQTLHLVCHGSYHQGNGQLHLGNGVLDRSNLSQYQEQLQVWGVSELVLYACEVGQDRDFVDRLSEQTGAKVAAATGKVGNADLGGNWHLAYQNGDRVETLAFDAQTRHAYAGVLANFRYSGALDSGTSVTETIAGRTMITTGLNASGAETDVGIFNGTFSAGNNLIRTLRFAFSAPTDVNSFKVCYYTNTGPVTSFTIQGTEAVGNVLRTYNVTPTDTDLFNSSGLPVYTVNLSGANNWGPLTRLEVIANGGGTAGFAADDVLTHPLVAGIAVTDTTLTAGETTPVTITFSEAVTGFTNADLTVENGTLSSVSSSDGGITWTATLTPTANITDATNVITSTNSGFTDLDGNAGIGTTSSNNYAIDTQLPTVTSIDDGDADNTVPVGTLLTYTVTFSEDVTSVSAADFNNAGTATIAIGTVTETTPTSGVFRVPVTPSTTGTIILRIPAGAVISDVSGNNLVVPVQDNDTVTIPDTTPPSVTSIDDGDADNTIFVGTTLTYTITFSEDINAATVTAADFNNAGTATIAIGTITETTPTSGIFTVQVTPSTTGTILLRIPAGAVISDVAGNNLAVPVQDVDTVTVNPAPDTTPPTATISVTDTSLISGETSPVTITFSEAVTGFTNADLTVANGTLSPVSSSNGGITWTATLTPTANITDATNVITLDNSGVTDSAGNAGTGTTNSNNYAIDNQRPTATISVTDTALIAGETSPVTITFSEAVTGFTNADLTVANGTLSPVSSSNGGITWTATLTPTANITDATNVITLDNAGVTDTAGNAGTGTTNSNNYAIDNQRPTATISVTDTSLRVGETSPVTITFSEAVTGFTNADLTVANGTLSSVSSSDGGITWTATLTPTANITDATNVITLDNTGVTDTAGNAGTGTTTSNNYAIDNQRPTAAISVTDTSLIAGETSPVTITFSEAVTGFTNADLTVANGTLSPVSSSDGGITWTATLTPTANITDATNVITLDNTGVADSAGNAGTGSTDSNNYAIDTALPTIASIDDGDADNTIIVGDSLTYTIAFSEDIDSASVTAADFNNAGTATIAIGTITETSAGVFTVPVTPSTAGTIILRIPTGAVISDVAGNNLAVPDQDGDTVTVNPPTVTIAATDSTAAEAGSDPGTFRITRTGVTDAALTVSYAIAGTATNGTDYTPTLAGSATIPVGASSVDITINPVDDVIFEGSETAILTLTETANYDLGTAGTETATVAIADNDFALAIAPTDANKLEGNTGNTPFTFTVTRTGDTSSAVTTNWTVTGGATNPANAADFGGIFPTGTVNFGVGETTKAIAVNVSGDTLGELDENFTVTLSNPSIPATITTATAAGSIRNDDNALVVNPSNATQAEGNSGLRAFTFTINRTGATNITTDLKWTVTGSGANPANAADFDSGILPVGKVRFLPGETSKLISVNVRGDTTVESDETFSVTITAVAGGSTPVTIGTGTIVNDDGVAASRTAAIRSAVILGTAGNDALLGVDPLNGAGTGEVDRLSGGEGSDRFVLGDSNSTYYLGNGMSDYALITDFGATDVIRTHVSSPLSIGGILPAGILGTALYLNTDLVAVVQGVFPTSASFVSV